MSYRDDETVNELAQARREADELRARLAETDAVRHEVEGLRARLARAEAALARTDAVAEENAALRDRLVDYARLETRHATRPRAPAPRRARRTIGAVGAAGVFFALVFLAMRWLALHLM